MPRGIPRKREVVGEEHIRQGVPTDDPRDPGIEIFPPLASPKTELELFMNDVLTVYINEDKDKNATKLVEVSVNGRRIFIPRGTATNMGWDISGRQVPIKRMFVERLARAKETSLSQDLDLTDESMNRLSKHRALTYPFSVTHDPAGEVGQEWVKQIWGEP